MKVFARDARWSSIDADLATTSGLEAGVAAVDQRRALNVGVAEANMMLIGEAFAALGHNTWISTFCPFFDWKVMRRIAVGHQERLEAMAARDGWLSEGHGLDLTMLATAANFETRTNGATHMGNDDSHDVRRRGPSENHRRLVSAADAVVMRWIMEGNRGLLYVRVMRTPSAVLYGGDYAFEFGKGHFAARERPTMRPSSSAAAAACTRRSAARRAVRQSGHRASAVVDMPSIDEELLHASCASPARSCASPSRTTDTSCRTC